MQDFKYSYRLRGSIAASPPKDVSINFFSPTVSGSTHETDFEKYDHKKCRVKIEKCPEWCEVGKFIRTYISLLPQIHCCIFNSVLWSKNLRVGDAFPVLCWCSGATTFKSLVSRQTY